MLKAIDEIIIPKRSSNIKQVYHIYVIRAKDRKNLKVFLNSNGIDAKIHYPKPMHLQKAAKYLGYSEGDFPVAENLAQISMSLPVHEFITKSQIEYAVDNIKLFYRD